jgi:hypothetical protein
MDEQPAPFNNPLTKSPLAFDKGGWGDLPIKLSFSNFHFAIGFWYGFLEIGLPLLYGRPALSV